MNKNNWSRRKFLHMVSGLSIVPFIGKLQKFFPETDTAFTKSDAKVRAILQIPDDLVMQVIDGEKAAMMISQALEYNDARILEKSLTSFQPIIKEAHITSLSWANGTQNATVISVPFSDPQNNIATLQCVTKDGAAEINMVEFLDQKDWTKAKIHTIKNGEISTFDANPGSTIAGASVSSLDSTCTPEILIQCLGLWGCSGLALATCAAALILCPFTIWSCVAVYVCTLYCGGAWSYCFCWACGC